MKEVKPLVGFCPIGKFVFSNEDARKYKQIVRDKLADWQIRFVDIESICPDGLVKDQQQVDGVVEHFRAAKVDCLFVPHCNFGTEGAVGMIAKKLGVPVLLWGPRDEAPLPNGQRLRDTLCGLFASSKVLHKLNVPFTYIENCHPDSDIFKDEFNKFVRAVCVADALRQGVKIGLIGPRIDFFWSTIVNESELLQKFNIEIIPFDMADFVRDVRSRLKAAGNHYEKEADNLRQRFVIEGFDIRTLMPVLAVRDQMLALGEDYGLEGIAFRSFMSIIDECDAYCTLAESEVGERYAFGSECDVHGVISNLLLRRANFNENPAYLTEFTIRHPENNNAALLWHAGAPLSMCHPEVKPSIGRHWILPSPLPGMLHFRQKDGPVTLARFDGDFGQYKLAIGQAETAEGPKTLNNYLWVEVNDWPKWERTLIEGPFIHHLGMIYGRYADVLVEACKYMPGVESIRLDC